MFKISDKVVCVDDKFPPGIFARYVLSKAPRKGEVYVVRDVYFTEAEWCLSGIAGGTLLLVGIACIINPITGIEVGFAASRFRKLEDIKEENRRKQEEPQPV